MPSGTTNLYFAGRLIGTQDRLGSSGSFYPYGEEYMTTAQNRFKFATYYRDGTALDYAKKRYYWSAMGRFMSADPYINTPEWVIRGVGIAICTWGTIR